jgi:hypothetical protein
MGGLDAAGGDIPHIVFDAPRHARGFFEALVAVNLDIGRPHNVEIIFARKVRRDTRGVFRTAIDRRDNGVLVIVSYEHSRTSSTSRTGGRCGSRRSSTPP